MSRTTTADTTAVNHYADCTPTDALLADWNAWAAAEWAATETVRREVER